jgi:stage V sporulation protein R
VQEGALREAIAELWTLARRAGLDPLPTHFEIVPATVLYEIAAYGLPGRFSHWSHGKAYQNLKAQYDLGLVKHFELVINADPAQAFLLETNDLCTNKFVVAHVLGHADFFHHNVHFQGTDREMAERVALHAQRLRAYELRYGREEVERFLDAVLALEEHVDPWAGAAPVPPLRIPRDRAGDRTPGQSAGDRSPGRFGALFPPPASGRPVHPPRRPGVGEEGTDLLLFLLRHATELEDWQRDAIAIVREEALYFRPQLRTKVMNEGWATLWHTRLLRELGLTDAEYTDFARLNAAVRAPHPGMVNPYLLGVAIYEDILERRGEDEGLRECFLIREVEDDVAFLRNHFTREVAERLDMFVYARAEEAGQPVWKITAKDFETVRETLVRERENGGRPVVVVVDAEGGGGRELVLEHRHDGRDLDLGDAQKALEHVARIWGHRCRLRTRLEGQPKELVADPPSRRG